MRHTYRCPLRWADLDELGHVNNVVYADYLQEARVDLLRSLRGHLGAETGREPVEGLVVVRHEISYLAPLVLGRGDLHVQCWVTEVRAASFTLAYEMFHPDAASEGGRRLYARASTVLSPFVFAAGRPRRLSAEEREAVGAYLEAPGDAPRARVDRPGDLDLEASELYSVQVRFSDVDVYRHVNNVKYVEYLQEARVVFGHDLWRDPATPSVGVVVAQTDLDYHVPMVLRAAPYDVWSRVTRLGSRSIRIDSEIRDGDVLCARGRVTLVFFDRDRQCSVEPSPLVRERVAASAGLDPRGC